MKPPAKVGDWITYGHCGLCTCKGHHFDDCSYAYLIVNVSPKSGGGWWFRVKNRAGNFFTYSSDIPWKIRTAPKWSI